MPFDLNSLIPPEHAIQYVTRNTCYCDYMKLSVDTMLSETPIDIPDRCTITPNGALYRTDKRFPVGDDARDL